MQESNEPLGLPRGSVRAILAIVTVGGAVVMHAMNITVPDWLISMAGTAFGFYFGMRKLK
ncbi:hypothetical protein Asulf_01528 [Archaeoglobus sulfaticallidus PM70-1]|uniref:Uncharacterized protein n=1 Tax=Archaeoglobus sulfaticallidus PM70-1 TaxID=387631 RepID=N0BLU8_9EURY|nr:hypothetical protein [Archaeoglobus sulfaticallidus]AGK61506.1 hypothetical protein Asulf_01528 [Archaeoglobus sulfaticallidus PM70-1]